MPRDPLAISFKTRRGELEAESYEDVARQLDSGSLVIRNADPNMVRARMTAKAAAARAGVHSRPHRSYGGVPADLVEDDSAPAPTMTGEVLG